MFGYEWEVEKKKEEKKAVLIFLALLIYMCV